MLRFKYSILFLIFFSVLISCNKNTKVDEQEPAINNKSEIKRGSNSGSVFNDNKRFEIIINSTPQGADIFHGNGYLSSTVTPVTLNLEAKEYKYIIKHLRYYPKEIIVDVNKIRLSGNYSIHVDLERNSAFTDEHYLSYSTYVQADGMSKETQKYVYDENAQLIRIDSYIRSVLYNGYYKIEIDKRGNIISKQYINTDGVESESVEHLEYNDENQLIKSWSVGSNGISSSAEYFYSDGILVKQVSKRGDRELVFDYIVETEYGSPESGFTKSVDEKYFYASWTEEERQKALESNEMPRTYYVYQ